MSPHPLRVPLWVLKQKTSLVTQMDIYTLLPPVCIRVTFWGGEGENRQARSWS